MHHRVVARDRRAHLPLQPLQDLGVEMRGGFGGMLSIRLRAGEAAAKLFTAKLRVFKQATSLGSVESLAEHRASVEGPDTLCPADLVRLSIGVEYSGDLVADIEQALG